MKLSNQLFLLATQLTKSKYSLNNITDQDFNRLPNTLYSATPYYNYNDIINTGLGNINVDYMFNKNGFFLATDEENAMMYANYDGVETIVFKIKKSNLDKNKLYYDQNDCYTDDYVTLLKGQQYSWDNGDENLECYTSDKYWNKHKYNICLFYNGIVKVNNKNIL